MSVHYLHIIYLAQLVSFTRIKWLEFLSETMHGEKPQVFLKLGQKNILKHKSEMMRTYSQVFTRNSMNQPVKPKQTLTMKALRGQKMLGSTYQLQNRPCHLVATATTRDVSAVATQAVKAFQFRQFCDSHESEGKYGFTRSKISIHSDYMQLVKLNFVTIKIIIIITIIQIVTIIREHRQKTFVTLRRFWPLKGWMGR